MDNRVRVFVVAALLGGVFFAPLRTHAFLDELAARGAGGIAGCAATILVDAGLSSLPTNVQGFLNVPVNDTSLNLKEKIQDCAAWVINSVVIEGLIEEMITWINTGFDGGPAYVQSIERHVTDILDDEIEMYLQSKAIQALGTDGEIIAASLSYEFGEGRSTEERLKRTLDRVFDTEEAAADFVDGAFEAGGWAGWFELTQRPQNNFPGAYTIARTDLEARLAARREVELLNLDYGQGFRSQEIQQCYAEVPVEDTSVVDPFFTEDVPIHPDEVGNYPGAISYHCDPPRIVTPGAIIKGQFQQVLGSGLERLINADELNEAFTQFFTNLFRELFAGEDDNGDPRGLFGVGDYLDQDPFGQFDFTDYLGISGGGGRGGWDLDCTPPEEVGPPSSDDIPGREQDPVEPPPAVLHGSLTPRDIILDGSWYYSNFEPGCGNISPAIQTSTGIYNNNAIPQIGEVELIEETGELVVGQGNHIGFFSESQWKGNLGPFYQTNYATGLCRPRLTTTVFKKSDTDYYYGEVAVVPDHPNLVMVATHGEGLVILKNKQPFYQFFADSNSGSSRDLRVLEIDGTTYGIATFEGLPAQAFDLDALDDRTTACVEGAQDIGPAPENPTDPFDPNVQYQFQEGVERNNCDVHVGNASVFSGLGSGWQSVPDTSYIVVYNSADTEFNILRIASLNSAQTAGTINTSGSGPFRSFDAILQNNGDIAIAVENRPNKSVELHIADCSGSSCDIEKVGEYNTPKAGGQPKIRLSEDGGKLYLSVSAQNPPGRVVDRVLSGAEYIFDLTNPGSPIELTPNTTLGQIDYWGWYYFYNNAGTGNSFVVDDIVIRPTSHLLETHQINLGLLDEEPTQTNPGGDTYRPGSAEREYNVGSFEITESDKRADINLQLDGHYPYAAINFDFFLGPNLNPYSMQPEGWQHVFMIRQTGDMFGGWFMSLAIMQNVAILNTIGNNDKEFDVWHDAPVNWTLNHWYHVSATYDAVAGLVTMVITDKESGATVARMTAGIENSIYPPAALILGNDQRPLIGSKIENLRLVLTPGAPVCNNPAGHQSGSATGNGGGTSGGGGNPSDIGDVTP